MVRAREIVAIVAGALAGGFVGFVVTALIRGPSGRVWFTAGSREALVDDVGRRTFLDRFTVLHVWPNGGAVVNTGAFGPVELVPVNGLFRVVVNSSPELGRQLAEDLIALGVLVPGGAP